MKAINRVKANSGTKDDMIAVMREVAERLIEDGEKLAKAKL